MIFNSLGSNYNFGFALKALFAPSWVSDVRKLQDFLKAKYQGKAVLLYKGREALALALQVLSLPKDSLVLVNGYTCFAVYQAIIEAGCRPGYLDIAQGDLNFSAASLKVKLESHPETKVVITQNTLGYPCDMEAITEICRQKNVVLIEDLAHSAGAIHKNGQEAGSFGDFVVLSFSQDKIIDAVSGGALIIRNKKYENMSFKVVPVGLKQRIVDRWYPILTFKIRKTYAFGLGKIIHKILKASKLLSQPMGSLEKLVFHSLPGWYCRLAYECFEDLSENIIRRRKIAQIYLEKINHKVLFINQSSNATNLRFPILIENRSKLIEDLKNHSIHISDIWYDAPIAPAKYMTQTNYAHECPESEKLSRLMLNLPTHNGVSPQQAENLAEKINLWLQ